MECRIVRMIGIDTGTVVVGAVKNAFPFSMTVG